MIEKIKVKQSLKITTEVESEKLRSSQVSLLSIIFSVNLHFRCFSVSKFKAV